MSENNFTKLRIKDNKPAVGRARLEIMGGVAVAEQIEASETQKMREKFKNILPGGKVEYDEIGFMRALFYRMLVGLEGFADADAKELELNDDVKRAIAQVEPNFVTEFIEKAGKAFKNREDIAGKN